MAAPTITNTFSNSTVADATEVNTNFNDLLNAITDGNSDLSFSALTVAGTATLNGAVTLGNATGDAITVTGRISSNILPTTTANNDLGATTNAWQAIYLDNGATDGGALFFNAGTTEFIKSDAAGSDLDISGFADVDFNSANVKGAANGTFTGTLAVTGIATFTDAIVSNSSTDSSSITTGAVQTDGGLGVVKACFIGTTLNVAGNSTLTGTTLMTGDATHTGKIIVNDTTDSTSTTTGSIQTDGGLGVAKDIYAGSDIIFPNGGGSALSNYEEENLSVASTGGMVKTCTGRAVRVGDVVTVMIDQQTDTATTAAAVCTIASFLTNFKPANNIAIPIMIQDASGAYADGRLEVIAGTGNVIIFPGYANGGVFTAAGQKGWPGAIIFSYPVN